MRIIPVTPDDPRVGDYRGVRDPELARRLGLFIAESRLVVERLVRNGRYRVRSLLLTPTALDAVPADVRARLEDVPIYVCEPAAMDAIAGVWLHQGCVALAERPPARDPAALMAAARTVVVTEALGNPDNVGGVFRNAAAFGVDAVLLSPSCGDPLYRKAIRTSMAATLSMPFARLDPWPAALQSLQAAGIRLVALSPRSGARPLENVVCGVRQDRVAVLVGAEGPGLSDAALAAAADIARIPMAAGLDSLNVSVATGIALYALLQARSAIAPGRS